MTCRMAIGLACKTGSRYAHLSTNIAASIGAEVSVAHHCAIFRPSLVAQAFFARELSER
jgi:hypothetical protein